MLNIIRHSNGRLDDVVAGSAKVSKQKRLILN